MFLLTVFVYAAAVCVLVPCFLCFVVPFHVGVSFVCVFLLLSYAALS